MSVKDILKQRQIGKSYILANQLTLLYPYQVSIIKILNRKTKINKILGLNKIN